MTEAFLDQTCGILLGFGLQRQIKFTHFISIAPDGLVANSTNLTQSFCCESTLRNFLPTLDMQKPSAEGLKALTWSFSENKKSTEKEKQNQTTWLC